jgi:hypothetical protein
MGESFLTRVLQLEKNEREIDDYFFPLIEQIGKDMPEITTGWAFLLFVNVRACVARDTLEFYVPVHSSQEVMKIYADMYQQFMPSAHKVYRFRKAHIIGFRGWAYEKNRR